MPLEIILNGKKTFKVDVFSLGCLFYYAHTKGKHPFGEANERLSNILKTKTPALDNIKGELLKDLINSMLLHSTQARIEMKQVVSHPFFYTPKQRLDFIHSISNFVIEKKTDRKNFNFHFKNFKFVWGSFVDTRVWKYVTEKSNYNSESLFDFLRFLRNIDEHWNSFKEQPFCSQLFRDDKAVFWSYFESLFPNLLWEVYNFAKIYNLLNTN